MAGTFLDDGHLRHAPFPVAHQNPSATPKIAKKPWKQALRYMKHLYHAIRLYKVVGHG
jgi:hypothetical protein